MQGYGGCAHLSEGHEAGNLWDAESVLAQIRRVRARHGSEIRPEHDDPDAPGSSERQNMYRVTRPFNRAMNSHMAARSLGGVRMCRGRGRSWEKAFLYVRKSERTVTLSRASQRRS